MVPGKANWSICNSGLTLTLKLAQILIIPFFLIMVASSVSHRTQYIFLNNSFSSFLSFYFFLHRSLGTSHVLWNLGVDFTTKQFYIMCLNVLYICHLLTLCVYLFSLLLVVFMIRSIAYRLLKQHQCSSSFLSQLQSSAYIILDIVLHIHW